MSVPWVCAVLACAVVCAAAERDGGSLRGALEALQRRQRGRFHAPQALPDYDASYEYLPPQIYPEVDYELELEEPDEDPAPKYIVKFLDSQKHPPENYEYKIVKKKNLHSDLDKTAENRKESAFRERSHHSENERLRDFFADKNELDEKKVTQNKAENDAEYAMLLGQLWSKYKNNRRHANNIEVSPQGIVKLYKEKIIKKRVPDNWGPIAFKKKRSPDSDDTPLDEYTASMVLKPRFEDNMSDTNYKIPREKNDIREEYAVAFQPLDDEPIDDITNDERFSYDLIEKRFPVSKRSTGPTLLNNNYQKKRYAQENKHRATKKFRSSSGTDPKIIKDLSRIFGTSEDQILKTPVKRSSNNEENSHETKPPQMTIMSHNATQEHNSSSRVHDDDSHEQHGHSLHHPGISGKEVEQVHPSNLEHNKPITIKKKSIDWSQYFGIDRRRKKSVINNLGQDRIRKQYFDTFNKEVMYPLNSFRNHAQVKRNYVENKPNEETEIQIDSARALAMQTSEKGKAEKDNDSKLDEIDRKLKNMESMIVDEALHYSNVGEELDSKEEQEVKEKLLSRLAAAYSLEKMRKAMKEFKQSLKIQKNEDKFTPITEMDEKSKRTAIKKEKADLSENYIRSINKPNSEEKESEEFEGEQGAGHYLNGQTEEQFSEGYMGGSGRNRTPLVSFVGGEGTCPVLERIVQRCRGVDLLAGDRGQLFLPLCSLHQICYLCGEAPPTTCDLVFLSEADTACDNDSSCQRAARAALMALRELHDALADELDGECEASPCLPATLKLNLSWQRALQR